ncbi:CFI-box-CTERM domain-containing protein [[Eubacterium] cellulosolvens]
MRLTFCLGCLCLLLISAYAIEIVSSEDQILWIQETNLGELTFAKVKGIAVDDSGLYVVGYDNLPAFNDYEWRIEKRNISDGLIIWSQTENLAPICPHALCESALAVTVDNSGLYIIGYCIQPEQAQFRIEKRNLIDGSLIWSRTEDFNNNYLYFFQSDIDMALTADSSGLYVSISSYLEQTIEKRNLTNGSIIWNITEPANELYINSERVYDRISDITVDDTGLYLVGDLWDENQSSLEWRIEKRSKTDGALLWKQISDYPDGINHAYGVASDVSGLYVAGHIKSNSSGYSGWRIEKRNLADGSEIWHQEEDNVKPPSDSALMLRNYVDVDESAVYMTGIADFQGKSGLIAQKRNLTDGTLLGMHNKIPSPFLENLYDMDIYSSGIYTANYPWRLEKWNIDLPPPIIVNFASDTGQIGFSPYNYSGQIRMYNNEDVAVAFQEVNYTISAFPAPGYVFIKWESTGGVSVIDPDSSYTIATVSSSGTLRMVQTSIETTNTTTTTDTTATTTTDDTTTDTTTTTIDTSTTTTDSTTTTTDTLTTTDTPTPSPSNKPPPSTKQSCVIVTASYGSDLAPEVYYMRYVRDNMIGSTDTGKILVSGWNTFYYSWSPYVSNIISHSETLQYTFRILLLPLVAIIHSTANIYSGIAPLSLTSASIIAFIFAAVSSTVIYFVIPLITLIIFSRKFIALVK